MYLSRIQLNPARRAAQPLIESPHVLHAAVMAAFPDASPTADGRVLWRMDAKCHVVDVYIVSPRMPDLTALAEQGGWPSLPETRVTRPYAPLLERIENGQCYAFRLTANPTHSRGQGGFGRGKVHGHVTVRQQEDWLLARAGRAGFGVRQLTEGGSSSDRDEEVRHPLALDVIVSDRRTVAFSRREAHVTLSVATFDGTLVVCDRDRFVHALSHGIGRAKGYGCGLLTIAPVG